MSQVITTQHLEHALSMEAYDALVRQMVDEGKTTGPNQREDLIHYTQLNLQRMDRIAKRGELLPELEALLPTLTKPWLWVILTESWCGDAAQSVPYITKMAALAPAIELKILLRDENLDIMDAHLTNGGRSIPKLICLEKETLRELGDWGPRPKDAQQILIDYKANPGDRSYHDFHVQLHTWYARNKGQDMQHELLALIQQWDQQ